jgi:hypothetical protein
MTIEAPKLAANHPDRDIHCQESLQRTMQMIVSEAKFKGWGTIEAISAMEEVLKNLRLAYAEHPDAADDPSEADTGDANDFGEFPSAEGLLKATVEGREHP